MLYCIIKFRDFEFVEENCITFLSDFDFNKDIYMHSYNLMNFAMTNEYDPHVESDIMIFIRLGK